MSKRPHIRAIGESEEPDSPAEREEPIETTEFQDHVVDDSEWFEETQTRTRVGALFATLAALAILGWSAFFVWANLVPGLGSASPQQWTQLIAQWSTPVLLIGVIWLLVMRHSAREAARFADVAHLLSTESMQLEKRLASVNRELSLAREFLTTQSRELEFLGRNAVERISGPADQLQDLVRENGEKIDAIASVSVTALENMRSLREDLPVVANAARDASNQIGGAGRTAKNQLAELIEGFERLNEFGQASERQVTSLRGRIGEALETFDQRISEVEQAADARFEALRDHSQTFFGALDDRQNETIAGLHEQMRRLREEMEATGSALEAQQDAVLVATRERIAGLEADAGAISESLRSGERSAIETWQGQITSLRERLAEAIEEIAQLDARAIENANAKLKALTSEAERVDAGLIDRNRHFEEQIDHRERAFEAAQAEALDRFRKRLEVLDSEMAERREALAQHLDTIGQSNDRLKLGFADIDSQVAAMAEKGSAIEAQLVSSANRLSETVNQTTSSIEATETALASLTDSSVRVLEMIQASAKHSKTELPAALGVFEARLAEARSAAGAAVGLLEQGSVASDVLLEAIERLRVEEEGAAGNIDALRDKLTETVASETETLGLLREKIGAVDSETSALAEKVSGALRDSIGQFENAGRGALEEFERQQREQIDALAGRIGEQSATAIEKTVADVSRATIEQLNQATEQASAASRDLIEQLRDQLARVNELTGNLESRIDRARAKAEEQVDNDFARRVALITESLNSNAIDIAKVLSTEVTDTAWASYLRGDRSVFTRRAVRLIDNSEAREIADLYDADTEFRGHVSRYIHDFESMLRTLLSTRDGNALGVTLLSSDMGKLYVVLAQAIERLRE